MALIADGKQRRRVYQSPLLIVVLLSIFCALFFGRYNHDRVPQDARSKTIIPQELDTSDLSDLDANASQLMIRDDYSCTKDQPCKTNACCGGFFGGKKGTCGFGPNFCGRDCASNCNAKSECGANADPPGKGCPLNVCCSEFGFCGTTPDFCGKGCQSNCGKVQVPAGKADGGVLKKVIGYYEAWSARWTCGAFPPAALPIDGLTHVNFAFAGIDPTSFEVTTMDPETPASLFMETADVRTLKSGNLDLQVFASIGGWSFSDNDTKTQPVFGNIAKDAGNRQKFANNVVSFMKEYGFDGVDIDWEYPGAPDRGGHKDDTKNYVALMKTLRSTFDKSGKGKYGLTFTIPTSYWYLRWFDLPRMLKYADWVNFMTYDLHGAWDMDDPIGNIVQGHTNLTEIKQSVELLWRNDVQPKQVVLGFGFYGRSFQLENADCSKTGCKFKAGGLPGPCTKGTGTLAYYEIQDIIKDQKPDIIHDKEAAVNYFTYEHKDSNSKRSVDGNDLVQRDNANNQWVSFDDKTTMKQKVDWANKLGLGGSMIWSVDQDDSKFSALEGLIGRSLTDFDDELAKSQVTDTGYWASQNGQKCKITDCHKDADLRCDDGFALAPGGKKFKDNCGGAGNRQVCCPVDSMPTSCQWRGGEVGRSCHGQCHTGEVTLFHSRHATVNCFRPGFQAFCCEASTFTALIDACIWTGCKYLPNGKSNPNKSNTTCPAGTVSSASRFDPIHCGYGPGKGSQKDREVQLCCPTDSAFQGCHWVGKGTCDDNECGATDIQVDRDAFGLGGRCAGGANDREKSLCCNTPKNLDPFLPVSLDKLFPTKPPEEDLPKFDLTIFNPDLGNFGLSNGPDANNNAFCFLVLDGPASGVQSLSKRDGSHWDIVSCEPMQDQGATLQIICTNDRPDSNCHDIYIGGVEGTIVNMPDKCGPGKYAVVHSIQPSISQELPPHVRRGISSESIVYDIELDYDFSLAKRDVGDIYIRIDCSNMPGYWNQVVAADPDTATKRSNKKRFWSDDSHDWSNNIGPVRDTGDGWASAMGKGEMDTTLFATGKGDLCKSGADEPFLNVKLTGSVSSMVKFGYTFVGTIAPDFHLEEAYGFFDSNIDHEGHLEFDGRGKIEINGDQFEQKSLFDAPLAAYTYNHPGIFSLAPTLDVLATVTGSGDVDGKFTADFVGGNAGHTLTSFAQPKSLGGIGTGGPSDVRNENAFDGDVTSKTSTKSSGKVKRATGDSTIFAINFHYKATMQIDISNYGTKLDNANITINEIVDGYVRVQGIGDDGNARVTQSNRLAAYEYDLTGDIPGWEQSTDTVPVGKRGNVNILFDGNVSPGKRDAPDIDGKPLFDSTDVVSCGGDSKLVCLEPSELLKVDPSLKDDPETGQPYEGKSLQKRVGNSRPYRVRTGNGNDFIINSPTYPNGDNGADLLAENPNAGHYSAEDPFDCENTDITDDSTDTTNTYVTEHILELNYFANFLSFAIRGSFRNLDGTTYRTTRPTVAYTVLNAQSPFQQDYQTWDTALGDEHPGSPVNRLWQVFGSESDSRNLVNAEMGLNSIKARVWAGIQPMSDATWTSNGFDRAGATPVDLTRLEQALSFLRATIQVIAYMNNDDINTHLGNSMNDFLEELQLFSDRYNAVHNANIDLADLHREYIQETLVRRTPTVQAWLQRRLQQLQTIWSAQANATPAATRGVLQTIANLQQDVRGLNLDTSRLPAPP